MKKTKHPVEKPATESEILSAVGEGRLDALERRVTLPRARSALQILLTMMGPDDPRLKGLASLVRTLKIAPGRTTTPEVGDELTYKVQRSATKPVPRIFLPVAALEKAGEDLAQVKVKYEKDRIIITRMR